MANRNLVSACAGMQLEEGRGAGGRFSALAVPCREGRLSAREFSGRFAALEGLTAGKLRPALEKRK